MRSLTTEITILTTKPMMHTKDIHTLEDAQRHVEGIINDFEEGISTKEETVSYLFDYTIRVMEIAMEATKNKLKIK